MKALMSYGVALVVALGGTAEADQGGNQAIHSPSEIRVSEPRIAADVQRKYDVGYSICQTVAPVGGADYPVANAIYPTTAAAHYFDSRGIHVEQSNLPKVTLIDAPKHGELENGQVYGAYLYRPNKDYFGIDRMIFSVEVRGKVFKVIYSVDVVLAPDSGSPSCPTGNGIRELPAPAK